MAMPHTLSYNIIEELKIWNGFMSTIHPTTRGATAMDADRAPRRNNEVEQIIQRAAARMRQWGITVTYLATQLGVSRQYAWQVMYYRTMVSREKALEFEAAVDSIVSRQSHVQSFGDRLRAARVSQGLTLKEVAEKIGYSWVGVERWEKNVCLPKPGVLWHLRALYGVDESWLPHAVPQATSAPAIAASQWPTVDGQRRVA
jgi:transcriptional regulator with XRE-family HTH domain